MKLQSIKFSLSYLLWGALLLVVVVEVFIFSQALFFEPEEVIDLTAPVTETQREGRLLQVEAEDFLEVASWAADREAFEADQPDFANGVLGRENPFAEPVPVASIDNPLTENLSDEDETESTEVTETEQNTEENEGEDSGSEVEN